MSALDAERQIADGNLVGGDRVNIDAEPLAAHAERIADAVMVVEVIAGGQRVQHHALVAAGILAGAGDDAERIVLAHRACGSATLAEKLSLFSLPQVTATRASSTMTPAMRSAVSTAERMQCSARSRWVIMPPLRPSAR